MIVRIMSDNQYRIDDKHAAAIQEIDRLDAKLFTAMETNDDRAFQETLAQLVEHVHSAGRILPDSELAASDVIVPPADITLAETKSLLATT
ncbi:MAG: PspA-associated protein PspAA [Ktedonobacterales bacterium]